jgi:hypothetical protein
MRPMTDPTPRKQSCVRVRIGAWIGRRQLDLSDRAHAAADDRACRHGWEITKSTGRFGFGARRYHDPRFWRPAPALAPVRSAQSASTSPPGHGAPSIRPGQKPGPERAPRHSRRDHYDDQRPC